MSEGAYLKSLRSLAKQLPTPASSIPIADQARAALGFVVRTAVEQAQGTGVAEYESGCCPNCGICVSSNRTPYCSECCKEEAAFVRQLRHGIASGSVAEVERQIALGQKFWRILGGGYPLRQSLVLDRTLAQVVKRTGGLCEGCGAPATTVDHIGTG